jgi:hypothetical protein
MRAALFVRAIDSDNDRPGMSDIADRHRRETMRFAPAAVSGTRSSNSPRIRRAFAPRLSRNRADLTRARSPHACLRRTELHDKARQKSDHGKQEAHRHRCPDRKGRVARPER